MDDMTELLQAARDAYRRQDWSAARTGFNAAHSVGGLSADDLDALSDAAWWLGHAEESLSAAEQAYRRYLFEERPRAAAMAAMGIAVNLFLRGDEVIGSGWMSRAQRLLRGEPECAEHGYVLYLLDVESALDGPDLAAVVTAAQRVRDIGAPAR